MKRQNWEWLDPILRKAIFHFTQTDLKNVLIRPELLFRNELPTHPMPEVLTTDILIKKVWFGFASLMAYQPLWII